jgi:hypothetical protein
MSRGQGIRGGAVALLLLACVVISTTAYPLCVKNLGMHSHKTHISLEALIRI